MGGDFNMQETTTISLSIEVFTTLAFINNYKMMRYINTVYNDNKEYYYNFAKKSPYFNSDLIQLNRISKKNDAIKALGVLLAAEDDEELSEKILLAAEKAFPEYYKLFKRKKTVSFLDAVRSPKDIKNNAQLDSMAGIFLYFCNAYGISPDLTDDFSTAIIKRMYEKNESAVADKDKYWSTLKSDNPNISYDKIAMDSFTRIRGKNLSEVLANVSQANETHRFICALSDVALQSKIPVSMYDLEYFSSKELKNAIKAYLTTYGYEGIPDNESIDKFAGASLFIKSIARMYYETVNLTEEETCIVKDTEQYKKLKLNNDKLTRKIEFLNKSIEDKQNIINLQQIKEDKYLSKFNSLEEDLKEEKEKNRILLQLLEEKNQAINEKEENRENIINMGRNADAIVFGGPPQWQAEVRKAAPKYTCIPVDNNNFDVKIIDNADVIVIKTDYLSHIQYKRIIDRIRKLNKKIV